MTDSNECCLCSSLGTIYAKWVDKAGRSYLNRYCEKHGDRVVQFDDTEITKDEYMLLLAMKKL
jgi:hypothetical protein